MDTYILDKGLAAFAEINPELQIQTIRAFLFIAHRAPCHQKDVETALGMTTSSCSRNVSYWTDVRFDKRKGMGFVARIEDPSDNRYKLLTLSKKGRDFLDRLRS